MRHHITTSEALRRVFLPFPTTASRTYIARRTLPHRNPRPQCLSHPHGPRPLSTSVAPTLRPPSAAKYGPKSQSYPRDGEIDAYKIYMVGPDDDRLPAEPRVLADVLARLERDHKGRPTQYVQEVSPASAERPWPVCRLYDKKAVREAAQARRKKTAAKWQSKRLEFSWVVSDNDLGHRMARLKEFLDKGWRVEIVFGSRRKSGWMERREASLEEASALVEKIRKVVAEVEGVEEKPMQGTVGKEAVFCFEGRLKKKGG